MSSNRKIQQELLLRLKKQQDEAIEKVLPAETRSRTTGERLNPDELDQLMQAEQLQQQVRARVGTREEGLRAEAAKVLQTLKDNQLPRTGTQDRMESVANELDRIARQELEQIEPQLTEARKENEIGTMPTDPKTNDPETGEPRGRRAKLARNPRSAPKTGEPRSTDSAKGCQAPKANSKANSAQGANSKGNSKTGNSKNGSPKGESKAGNSKNGSPKGDSKAGDSKNGGDSKTGDSQELAIPKSERAQQGR